MKKEDEFFFKKSLGQNFIKDKNLAKKIINSSNIETSDIAIEIGCGEGGLTELILEKNPKRLIVVEIDKRCIEITKEKIKNKENYNKIEFINKDAIDLKINELNLDSKVKIISNLPYSLGSRILVNLLLQKSGISSMLMVFQKEVAKKIVSQKNSKEYGILSVLSQIGSKCKILFDIPPQSFFPVPKVNSSAVEFVINYSIDDPKMKEILDLLRIIFGNRRKMIKYNIKSNLISEDLLKKRAEELSIEEIFEISRLLSLK